MLRTVLEVALAPLLVAAATLTSRRWGSRAGGLVSAFPAVVGPVLLITAQQRGAVFAERAASATLLGLVSLSAFVVAYAWSSRRAGWAASLAAAWACAAMLGAPSAAAGTRIGLPVGLFAAMTSLAAARRALPGISPDPVAEWRAASARVDIAVRMGLTAALVALLTIASELAGPEIGGVLAALPVLASVLAVCTHRANGSEAVIALLRGMVSGMAAFVGFCAIVALLIVPAGIALAFSVGALSAAAAQVLALGGGTRLGLFRAGHSGVTGARRAEMYASVPLDTQPFAAAIESRRGRAATGERRADHTFAAGHDAASRNRHHRAR